MNLFGIAKRTSIAIGLYRPARWLSRRMRPAQWRAFKEDVALFHALIPAGALAFDVGANVGEKTEALLEAGAHVVAFEPNPLVLPELRARCYHRAHMSVVQSALGSGPAVATLHARKTHVLSSLDADWGGGTVVSTYHVPVVTLDAAIRRFGVPFYCKIDVEGWELEVLLGLSQPLPLVSFEFHLDERNNKKTLACLRRLDQFGPGRINLTPAERATFHFKTWMPLQEFLGWFPGDLGQTLPGHPYGDIFVMNEAAQHQQIQAHRIATKT